MRAVQALQAAQAVARSAAQAAAPVASGQMVVTGLRPANLSADAARAAQIDGRSAAALAQSSGWQNASMLSNTVNENGGAQVNVRQTAPKAILNWGSFSIRQNESVAFQQLSSESIALNHVVGDAHNGFQPSPSQIMGSIKANGQVWVINQNGILFTGTSQVNVAGLTASSLNISNDRFLKEIAATSWDAVTVMPQFSAPAGETAANIKVEAGASIAANGGNVILLAPNVANSGLLSAPGGQVALVAGDNVTLRASDATRLRGFEFEIRSNFKDSSSAELTFKGGGTASNDGLITADRGNITMVGLNVTQNGVLRTTTTVAANGSITLHARDQFVYDGGIIYGRSGLLTFGSGSVTAVLSALDDSGTIAATALTDKSTVDAQGWKIHLESGSLINAPSGNVNVQANYTNLAIGAENQQARVFADSGSAIDVSGLTDVEVPIAQNMVVVELRGNELRDSPLQRNSFLYGQKIVIDARRSGTFTDDLMKDVEWFSGGPGKWYGTPLADTSGYIGLIRRGIGELSTSGGSIAIKSTGDLVTSAGSSLTAAGGSIKYLPGYVSTTKLLSADGRIVDIANADPSQAYVGIAGQFVRDHTRWGANLREVWLSPLVSRGRYDPGYTEGKQGGTIQLAAAQMVLAGDIAAPALLGERQRDALALGGSLLLGHVSNNVREIQYPIHDLVLKSGPGQAAVQPPAFDDAPLSGGQLVLSTDLLSKGGFSSLDVNSDGKVEIASDAHLRLPEGGHVKLAGRSVTVNGEVTSHGGTIDLTTIPVQQSKGPFDDPARDIVIGTGAVLDVGGKWTNDLLDGSATSVLAINGGSISLTTPGRAAQRIETANGDGAEIADVGTVKLAEGSILNVSGGGHVTQTGKLVAGNGGSITLQGGKLQLNGRIIADALAKGGALSLTAPRIQIGGTTGGDTLLLDPEFFRRGFGRYQLNGYESLVVAAGTIIDAARPSYIVTTNYSLQPTGISAAAMMTPQWRLPGQRQAVDLALSSTGVTAPTLDQVSGAVFKNIGGTLAIEQGAAVRVDPGASVALEAGRLLTVSGTIEAHGGDITLSITPGGDLIAGVADQSQAIWLTTTAALDVSGTTVLDYDTFGRRFGQVLEGGTVTFNDGLRGRIVTAAGSMIDVSGTVDTLDIASSSRGLRMIAAPLKVASAAGSINFTASQGMWLAGSYRASGGDAKARNGALTIFGGDPSTTNNARITADRIEVVAGAMPSLAAKPGDKVNLGVGSTTASSNAVISVSAADLAAGGFDHVGLASFGTVALQGGATLTAGRSITVDTPNLAVTAGGDRSGRIVAPDVAIGDTRELTNSSFKGAPSAGDGRLDVVGDVVDIVGNLALQNIGRASFTSSGDLRLVGVPGSTKTDTVFNIRNVTGTLIAAGAIEFIAAQVYPTTLGAFAVNSTTSVTIRSNGGAAPMPLSAGGKLTISAPTITQAGVLRAPLGTISLDAGATGSVTLARGSLTSVAAEGQLIPMGRVRNGNTWYFGDVTADSLDLYDLSAPLAKRVSLSGRDVDLAAGSRIDVSGGGDATAFEWVPGTGGSRDILTSKAGTPVYAVVPGYSGPAPRDAYAEANTDLKLGDSVYLANLPGLAAGWYTLLPGHYALLPGAYRVTVAQATADVAASLSIKQPGGSYLVAGEFGVAGTEVQNSRSSILRVMPGNVARTYSEYDDYRASTFFKQYALDHDAVVPRLAVDAGQIVLQATQALKLDGSMNFTPGAGGRGGLLDIAASSIAVVGKGDGPVAGYALTLRGDELSRLGAESLLIGGVRGQTDKGATITPISTNVLVANDDGSALTGPEIMLVAGATVTGGAAVAGTGVVTVADGSVIHTAGTVSGESGRLIIGTAGTTAPAGTGMGALLVATVADDVGVVRYDTTAAGGPVRGTLDIRSGARLETGGKLLFDATGDTIVSSGASLQAKALETASSRVSFGAAPADTAGLMLSPATLANLASVRDLTLRSYGTIDFWGEVGIGGLQLGTLRLDGASLVQRRSGDVSIAAQNLVLRNTSGILTAADDVANTGVLRLSAGTLTIGAGQSGARGFGVVSAAASREIVFSGAGGLGAGTSAHVADLVLSAPRITAMAGTDQHATATGTLTTVATVAPADLGGVTSFGGKLTLAGARVRHGGVIAMPASSVRLEATGATAADGVVLLAGSVIDGSAQAKPFYDQIAYASAGQVQLVAVNGAATVETGALIDLSAPNGGNAGTLSVEVPRGAFTLAGEVRGQATAGALSGSFDLDAGRIPDFASLSGRLNAGSFFAQRHFELRSGDIVLTGATQVDDLKVVADAGKVVVSAGAVLNADGEKGGSVRLVARDDLVVDAGATVSARGTNGAGGRIDLETSAGYLDLAAGSVLDVSGATRGGDVHVRAARTAETSGTIKARRLDSTLIGASVSDAEAFWVYQGISTIDQAVITQVSNAANAFAAQAPAKLGNFDLRAGIELESTGDMTLTADWDLHALRPGREPGYLTLRAAGNLTLGKSLSDGFTSASLGATLLTDRSWSYRLVAGADLSAADTATVRPLALLQAADTGDIRIGSRALVRTGTGNIDLVAGRNLSFDRDNGKLYYNPADPTQMLYLIDIVGLDGHILPAYADWQEISPSALLYNPNDPSQPAPFGILTLANGYAGAGVFRLDGKFNVTYAGWRSATGMDIIYDPANPSQTVHFLDAFRADGTLNPRYAGWRSADGGMFASTLQLGSFGSANGDFNNPAVSSIPMPAITDLMAGFLPDGTLDLRLIGLAAVPRTRQIYQIYKFGDYTPDPVDIYTVIDPDTGMFRPSAFSFLWLYSPASAQVTYSGGSFPGREGQVYTAGRLVDTFKVVPAVVSPVAGTGTISFARDGGNLSIAAAGNITGPSLSTSACEWVDCTYSAIKRGSLYDWLLRQGGFGADGRALTAWGADIGKFNWGIGTLGGGSVAIDAGGDISRLSAIVSDSGRVVGASTLETFGGGDLAVHASGNINGNFFYVANGAGRINTEGSLGSVEATAVSTGSTTTMQVSNILALGRGGFTVTATGDIKIGAMYNPTLVGMQGTTTSGGYANPGLVNGAFFSTYAANSSLDVQSTGGNLVLSSMAAADLVTLMPELSALANKTAEYLQLPATFYPPRVRAAALQGDISIGVAKTDTGRLILYPATDGNLTLLAGQSIDLSANASATRGNYIIVSDADPALLPGIFNPGARLYDDVLDRLVDEVTNSGVNSLRDIPGTDPSRIHAASLYHKNDSDPVRIYALAGSIFGGQPVQRTSDGGVQIITPKQTVIRAGLDIRNILFLGQNLNADDVTTVQAGRDIVFDPLTLNGKQGNTIQIGGIGQLEVLAGRNIKLSNSDGIVSLGDRRNPYLPEGQGTDIAVMTGLAGGVDYDGFADKYLNPENAGKVARTYVDDLIAFVVKQKGLSDISADEAWLSYREFPADPDKRAAYVAAQEILIRQIFFRELKTTGIEAKRPGSPTSDNYNVGYEAIATLFPAKIYSGDLDMFYSQIKTMEGGGINLLVPGGKINVGLSFVTADIGGDAVNTRKQRSPSELGLLTMKGGSINAFSAGSMLVNQSRVFTLGGGDIVAWSSDGDIDAGKGAKTALSAPPPRLIYDSTTGTYTTELSGEATGSGIATLRTLVGVPQGDIVLMAPHGTVDAGDAGIRVSGNLVIAAQFVRNADNIQVSGSSIGVPTAADNSGALTVANNTAGAASQQLEKPSVNHGDRPSVIIVEVIGYGGGDSDDRKDEKSGNDGRQSNYDPNGMVRIIGNGELTGEQGKALTDEEKRKL